MGNVAPCKPCRVDHALTFDDCPSVWIWGAGRAVAVLNDVLGSRSEKRQPSLQQNCGKHLI